MNEIENHPIKYGFIPNQIKTLVVGTFPPKEVYEDNDDFFFYASVRNHFWNRMENIFQISGLKKTKTKCIDVSMKQNKKDKQDFATEKGIGFLDIFTKVSRVKKSSKDEDLICEENIIENEILDDILTNNESLCRICCTYKLAFDTFKCKLDKNRISILEDIVSANGQKIKYTFKGREIEIYLLFPATRSGQNNNLKDEQYNKLLFGQID